MADIRATQGPVKWVLLQLLQDKKKERKKKKKKVPWRNISVSHVEPGNALRSANKAWSTTTIARASTDQELCVCEWSMKVVRLVLSDCLALLVMQVPAVWQAVQLPGTNWLRCTWSRTCCGSGSQAIQSAAHWLASSKWSCWSEFYKATSVGT